jgi:hypothetical protein
MALSDCSSVSASAVNEVEAKAKKAQRSPLIISALFLFSREFLNLSFLFGTARAEAIEFAVSLEFHPTINTDAATGNSSYERPRFFLTHMVSNCNGFHSISQMK